MHILQWVFREIRHRWVTSLLLFLAPCTIVCFWIAIVNILEIQEHEFRNQFVQREEKLKAQMSTMWNEYRKMTLKLGFNVLILPKGQNLADFYAEQFSSKYMPESYVDTLVNSDIATIQHILPALLQKVFWKEKKRSVLLYGVRGEVHQSLKTGLSAKAPMMQPVKKNSAILGYELSKSLDIKKGDRCTFLGKEFTIEDCHKKRGNRDDITIWIPLDEAQRLFDKQGLINSILALECRCATDVNLPNLAKIRTELEKILPETQVIEFKSEVLARAEARFAAFDLEKKSLEDEQMYAFEQLRVRRTHADIFLIIIATVIILFSILIYNLSFRSRYQEMAILRAIGFENSKLIVLLTGKLLVLGISGSLFGAICGTFSALAVSGYLLSTPLTKISSIFNNHLTIEVLFITIAVSVGVGLFPAISLFKKTNEELLKDSL